MLEQLENKFTKYEIARIIGARALQIAMDAPILLKINEKELEEINYNPIEIAKRELLAEVLPIAINRPMPKKREVKIRKLTKEEIEALRKEKKEEEVGKVIKPEEAEETEEKKIVSDAEIMELANPEDETEEETKSSEEE
jgi:DNA-directed RNA polymerase subunit K